MDFKKEKEKIIDWFKKLPERQKYFDFLKALLGIPFLVLLIIANVYTIKSKSSLVSSSPPSPSASLPEVPNFPSPGLSNHSPIPSLLPSPSSKNQAECKNEPQTMEIIFPAEGQKITSETPVCVVFSPSGEGYCPYNLNYRLNGGDWSQTSEKIACFYNLYEGENVFNLKVKNESGGQEKTYTRRFYYEKPSLSPSASPSSNPSQTPSSSIVPSGVL